MIDQEIIHEIQDDGTSESEVNLEMYTDALNTNLVDRILGEVMHVETFVTNHDGMIGDGVEKDDVRQPLCI